MPLNLEQKKALVSEVTDVAVRAISAVVVDYRGLTVSEMNNLRLEGRAKGVFLKVTPNNLAKRAIAESEFACLSEILVGPSLIGFSINEPSAAAKLFRDFAKTNEKINIKGIAINGKLHDATAIDAIAQLPTREEAIARLLATMQAPITKFVRTLAEPHARLVRVFAAVRDQKQAAA